MNQVNSPKISYRAEIDGLRAIAVISVILYHAQMVLYGRDWFEGGFIGVDIFFVISGYLITRIILSELESKGSFSFLNFYERRARRILPMLFVVIFVSVPYAWQKLLPSDLVEYTESILASLFFGSNFFFYFSTTEYGADSALLKPFLHTWSLGVEEQFYLVFPILAVIAFKYFRKHFLAIVVGLSLLSIQFAELMEVRNADLNFYLPFSRFWELAVGSMLAYRELYYKPSNEGFASKSLPMLGLYLLAYSILFFDGKTPHPSFHTLIPIIGVALIIGFASKDELVGKVLGSKPFVWVGLISYSAYLWHFPIFAFSRMGKESTNFDKLEWIALTLILSVLSYFLVEKPFRKKVIISQRVFTVLLLLCVILTSIAAIYALKTEGIWGRYTKTQIEVIKLVDKREYIAFFDANGVNCNERAVKNACRNGNEKMVFLGDSFIGSLQRAFVDVYSSDNFGYISFNYQQCPFIMDLNWYKNKTRCDAQNKERIEWFKSLNDSRVVFVATNTDQFVVPNKLRSKLLPNSSDADWKKYKQEQNELAWKSYVESISWLIDMGHEVVVVTSPPREHAVNALEWVPQNLQSLSLGRYPQIFNDSQPLLTSRNEFERFNELKGVTILDPTDYVCDKSRSERGDKSCWDIHPKLGPLYNGGSHFSYNAALHIAKSAESLLLERGILNH